VHRLFVAGLVVSAPAAAQADATQIGGWIGPRLYSNESLLGYIDDAPGHPMLQNTVMFGARIARPFFAWLVPELELAVAPTTTDAVAGAEAATVFWMDPRLHLRFEILPERRLQPFVVVGGGSPIALSSARMTFDSDIVGSGYVGGGVRLDTQKGFVLRFDARVAFLPGTGVAADEGPVITTEIDIGLGVEFHLGGKPRPRTEVLAKPDEPVTGNPDDKDEDGIVGANDQCPDRAEDADGFDDLDGCPDIDNDLDRVLDIADRCTSVGETYNGFQDDDGCPDSLPPEIDGLRGTVEGLIYADGETIVRDSAQPNLQKIAKIMTTHPSTRVVLIGHTDDREAKQFATEIQGQPPPDYAALSADLSRARAEAVKQALVAGGINGARIDTEGRGADEPVAENDKPRGRLANRRVEIKLYVPPSATPPR
jgi:outer membrane protein OmpA-like peptidoglycan-associated protein